MTPAERVGRAIEGLRGRPCVFCGAPAQAVGSFTPTDPEYRRVLHVEEGHDRILFYPTCHACRVAHDADLDGLERTLVEMFVPMVAAALN